MIEIAINKEEKSVQEVDVLRGSEVIKRFTDQIGSICFVVRRPG